MRKCYLCGSILRRRAEFCRYCTVRQPDAPGTGSLPPGAGEHGPVDSMTSVPPAPIDTTSLEQAMAPTARPREPEGLEVDLSAGTPPRSETPAPAVYEIDPAPTPDDAPLPAVLTPTAARPPSPPDARTNGGNGRGHRAGRNGHGKAPSTSASKPADKPASSNGSNNGASSPNGAHATNGHDEGEGRNGHTDEKTATRPRSTALSGFEHFPDATASPKVRWG